MSLCGLAVAAVTAGHALLPATFGLWSGPGTLFFGPRNDGVRAHQLPDATLYPVALLLVVLAWKIARELFGLARANLRRRDA